MPVANRGKPVLRNHSDIRELTGTEALQTARIVTWVEHVCKLGIEGIESKRRYRHGRSRAWLKIKNPASPAAVLDHGRTSDQRAWSA